MQQASFGPISLVAAQLEPEPSWCLQEIIEPSICIEVIS